MPDQTRQHEHPPDPRRPDVVDGEVLDERPAPPSPLDPDRDGVWPTALRPTPERRLGVLELRRRAIDAQVAIFRNHELDEAAGRNWETDGHARAHRAFYAVWDRLPRWARIGVWRTAVHRFESRRAR